MLKSKIKFARPARKKVSAFPARHSPALRDGGGSLSTLRSRATAEDGQPSAFAWSAFTLIELLVVIAILGIMATTVDKNGTFHLVYAAVSSGQNLDRSDIFYVRSTNGGTTFSAPVRLNDDATATSQWAPAITAAADGTVAVK